MPNGAEVPTWDHVPSGDGSALGDVLVGNDVVDLGAPEARGKSTDLRFVGRVFTAGEAARIRAAAEPELVLWMLWSAKEAAFKVARKLCADLPFAHRRFEAWLDAAPAEAEGGGRRASGGVRLHGGRGLSWLPVEWRVDGSLVHCVARSVAGRASSIRLAVAAVDARDTAGRRAGDDALTRRERDGARTTESRRVRRLAKALAREAGLGLVEIVRERRGALLGPPRLYAPAAAMPLPGWDLSLSHDGRFVAAALAGLR